MKMIKVLFICNHNDARSQIAEALLHKYGQSHFLAESAGLDPKFIDPLAIEILKEEDIDISHKATQSAFEFFQMGKLYHYVITMCDDSRGEKCPVFPGQTTRLHWSFKDPQLFEGSHNEKLLHMKAIKDEIKNEVFKFIKSIDTHEISL